MRNIKLTLAYDGTDFSGWQIQPGQPTIQGALSEVIEKLTQIRPSIHGAGRTDAGVHAAGQVANFVTESHIPAEEFQRALNALLPSSIRVLTSQDAAPDFHARWNAAAKSYRYRIFRGSIVPPFVYRYVLHHPYPLDFAAMAEAARRFEGEHDFATFAASAGSEEEDRERITTRTIYRSELRRTRERISFSSDDKPDDNADSNADYGDEWVYVVRGKSFLRYMVRKIVGTLVEVGRGRLSPDDIPKLLDARDRAKSGPTMPPQGLCMAEVQYADESVPAAAENIQARTGS